MANIKVHVLNFHGLFSHIEVVLENTDTSPHTFYNINRWAQPSRHWTAFGCKRIIQEASSAFSFDINACPKEIAEAWYSHWKKTESGAGILSHNCAVSAQWFLTTFAHIPKPSVSNVSFNHLALGILWPSFMPCPVTLPGRVMSNAKFHVNAHLHPERANKQTTLLLCSRMLLAASILSAAIFSLVVAAAVLTNAILSALIIMACVVTGLASTQRFFKAYNTLSAKYTAHSNVGNKPLTLSPAS